VPSDIGAEVPASEEQEGEVKNL